MESLRQLGGFHDDLWMEVQKRHARFRKGAFYPTSDRAIELQPSVRHKFGDFPTGDDANAEDAVRAKFEKFTMPRLQAVRSRNPPDPNVCPEESLQGVPVLAGNRLQGLTELENRIPQAPAPGHR